MAFLLRYLMIAVACVALLLGMQLPHLADQYAKRVDASLREATLAVQPFLIIANEHTGGSLDNLIALHRQSPVAPIRAEADAIEKLYLRKQALEAEHKALQSNVAARLWHMATAADPDLREQTLVQYRPVAPLSQDALISGAVVAALALLLLELGMALGRYVQGRIVRWYNHRWSGAAEAR